MCCDVIVFPHVFKDSEKMATTPSCKNTRAEKNREHQSPAFVLYDVNGKR